MESKVEVTHRITLVLTTEEANWLRGLMQNPIGVCDPIDERTEDRMMRNLFWNALTK